MKTCSKCKESKELTEFYIRSHRKSYQSECKKCAIKRASIANKGIDRKEYAKNYRMTLKYRLATYRHSGKDFNLSEDEFALFWQKPGSYCGSEIATIGIDRVDSSIGYELNNCVSCCYRCNTMKNNQNIDQWYNEMKTILTFKGLIS